MAPSVFYGRSYPRFEQKSFYFIHQRKQPGMAGLVIYSQPLFAAGNKTGISQNVEMLGDICLALIEHGLDVADTGFPIPQEIQDLQTGWVSQSSENIGFKGKRTSWGGHEVSIQIFEFLNIEYSIPPIPKS